MSKSRSLWGKSKPLRCRMGYHKFAWKNRDLLHGTTVEHKWHSHQNTLNDGSIWTYDIPYCFRCGLYIPKPVAQQWMDHIFIGYKGINKHSSEYQIGYADGKGDSS